MPSDEEKFYVPWYSIEGNIPGFHPVPPLISFTARTQILTKDNYQAWVQRVSSSDVIAIDTETTSLRHNEAELICYSIAVPDNKNLVVFQYRDFFSEIDQNKLADDLQIRKFLKLCLSRKRVFWWNLPYDLRVLLNPVNNLGLSLEHFSSSVDGLYLLYLADTNVKSGRGLKEIGHKYLGIPVESFEDAVGEDIKYSDVKSLITYAGRDALMTLEISERLYKFLMKRSPVLVELDIWLQKAIYTFEEQEYDMDLEYIDKLEQEVSSKLEEMKAEFYEKHGLINLGSSKQKADLLLAKGFSTGVFSEKTGQMSVSATALQNLIIQKGGCKPAELMDKISKYEKLLGSYIHSTQKHLRLGGGRRMHYLTNIAPTLRLAAGSYSIGRKKEKYSYYLSTNPQSFPKAKKDIKSLIYTADPFDFRFLSEGEQVEGPVLVESSSDNLNFKNIFTCPDTHCFIQSDVSQEELIVPGALSGEPMILEPYSRGEDIHRKVAAMIWHHGDESKVSSEERQRSKTCGFGLMYSRGGGAFTMQSKLKLSARDAEELVKNYENVHKVLYAWKEREVVKAKKLGYCRTYLGFERKLSWYFNSKNPKMFNKGFKHCINTHGQGIGGILIRIVLVKLYKMLYTPQGKWYQKDIKFFITVHDSVCVTCPKKYAQEFMTDFEQLMVSATPAGFKVPIRVELQVGPRYGSLFTVKREDDGLWYPKVEKPAVSSSEDVSSENIVEDLSFDESTEFLDGLEF
jgi:DNA polymerase-1